MIFLLINNLLNTEIEILIEKKLGWDHFVPFFLPKCGILRINPAKGCKVRKVYLSVDKIEL